MSKYLLLLFLFTIPAYGHSWYPSDCCSGKDCKPVECYELIETKKGISYKEYNFRKDQIKSTQDFNCHVCIHYGNPLCVFTMPSS